MLSLQFFSDREFQVVQGKKGKVLCHTKPGISLVLFHSNQCQHCPAVLDIFAALPRHISECQFAAVNVSRYPIIAQMAQDTIAPIDHVPFIILYVNGRPFMKYNGRKTIDEISHFVTEILSRVQNKRDNSSSSSGGNRKLITGEEDIELINGSIPYNIVCEGENCYLKFAEAYKK